jgi:methyl-accepting chemotaxis protein
MPLFQRGLGDYIPIMSDDPIANILAALNRLEVGQAELRVGQTELRDGQAHLRTELSDELGRIRADLMARMDRLQDAITAIRDDITVNFGRADHVQRNTDNARLELRALYEIVAGVRGELVTQNGVVSGMERQIQRLQTDVRALRGET